MINILPMKAEDMLWVIEHGVKELGLKALPNDEMRVAAEDREKSGLCMTGFVDGKIIGCAGVDILWDRVGEVWAMMTYNNTISPISAFRCIRDGLCKLIKSQNLQRVQAYARVDFRAANKMLKILGFHKEGLMKKYTPDGVDCYMYARIE